MESAEDAAPCMVRWTYINASCLRDQKTACHIHTLPSGNSIFHPVRWFVNVRAVAVSAGPTYILPAFIRKIHRQRFSCGPVWKIYATVTRWNIAEWRPAWWNFKRVFAPSSAKCRALFMGLCASRSIIIYLIKIIHMARSCLSVTDRNSVQPGFLCLVFHNSVPESTFMHSTNVLCPFVSVIVDFFQNWLSFELFHDVLIPSVAKRCVFCHFSWTFHLCCVILDFCCSFSVHVSLPHSTAHLALLCVEYS
jgi:hypothetical protein